MKGNLQGIEAQSEDNKREEDNQDRTLLTKRNNKDTTVKGIQISITIQTNTINSVRPKIKELLTMRRERKESRDSTGNKFKGSKSTKLLRGSEKAPLF